jgi:hypothetical protein
MDDYALHQALEELAGNAYNPDDVPLTSSNAEPISTTIARWHRLFGISEDDAIDLIMAHRNNLTRIRISNDHWEAIRSTQEVIGYDREAYEYELELQKRKANLPTFVSAGDEGTGSNLTYLVELGGVLDSPQTVQHAAGMSNVPEVVGGWSVEDQRKVQLCSIDVEGKTALLRWASVSAAGFEPTILVNPKSMRQQELGEEDVVRGTVS